MLSWIPALALAADGPLAMDPRVETLDNGLTVILLEDHRTDTIALHLAYGVGARDEADVERGSAHLFEHLMFEGSANVPTNAFDEWLTAAGGDNNAYTSEDVTAYHMEFPSGALELALFLESDRMGFLEAGLVQDNLENQQKVVLQERAEGYAEPNGRDWDALGRISWPADHPYHHPVIGTVADIEAFSLPAVRGFWEAHYRSRNAVLALVGNFETEEALERVEHWFSDVPDRGEPVERDNSPLPGGVRDHHGMLFDDVEERTLYVVWETVPLGHADEPALDLLSQLLSGGRGTRLDDQLYYEHQRTSDVGMFTLNNDRAGQILLYASSPKTPLAKVYKLALKQIQGLIKDPPTAEEVARARRAHRGWLLDALEQPDRKAEILVDCFRWTQEADCLVPRWARYEAVTPADVLRVAQTYLIEQQPNTLSVVPRGDDGAMDGAQLVELP
ncbi:MAG TPA: insulinase family protein [Deltaproteobacteria bacterium]|nr:insulinase family protein [Deltaproteobacteria bacterium]